MAQNPIEVVGAILAAPTGRGPLSRWVAEGATTLSFRAKGVGHVEADPDGGEATVGGEAF